MFCRNSNTSSTAFLRCISTFIRPNPRISFLFLSIILLLLFKTKIYMVEWIENEETGTGRLVSTPFETPPLNECQHLSSMPISNSSSLLLLSNEFNPNRRKFHLNLWHLDTAQDILPSSLHQVSTFESASSYRKYDCHYSFAYILMR